MDSDYEPADWDSYRFQAYGGFTAERNGYARNYGMSDEMWHRFLFISDSRRDFVDPCYRAVSLADLFPEGYRRWLANNLTADDQITIFGKSVQRGIAARVLESANDLLVQAYEVTDGPDLDGDGLPDWYEPIFSPDTGLPVVLFDAGLDHIRDDGTYLPGQGGPGCDANDNSRCTCASNRWCMALERYDSVPAYLREALDGYQLGQPEERGVY